LEGPISPPTRSTYLPYGALAVPERKTRKEVRAGVSTLLAGALDALGTQIQ